MIRGWPSAQFRLAPRACAPWGCIARVVGTTESSNVPTRKTVPPVSLATACLSAAGLASLGGLDGLDGLVVRPLCVAVDNLHEKVRYYVFGWVFFWNSFVRLTTRRPHGVCTRGAKRNRIYTHWHGTERLVTRTVSWYGLSASTGTPLVAAVEPAVGPAVEPAGVGTVCWWGRSSVS